MVYLVVLVGVLGIGIPATSCSDEQCSAQIDFYAVLQPIGNFKVVANTPFNFSCSSNLPGSDSSYPRWEINGNEYRTTNLPITVTILNDSAINFNITSNVNVRCFYVTDTPQGSVFSNEVTVALSSNITSLLYFPACPEKNTTFHNRIEVCNIHSTVIPTNNTCPYSINISYCDIYVYVLFEGELEASATKITYEFLHEEIPNGGNATITIDNKCDICRGSSLYLPNVRPTEYIFRPAGYMGTLIENLSNDYCNFDSLIIDYKICIHTRESNDCYHSPCGNGKIYTTVCNSTYNEFDIVSLVTDRAENDTLVAIYCLARDCNGNPSDVLVKNLLIFSCEECDTNADCVDGKCVCKTNYSGNGQECSQIATPSPSPSSGTKLITMFKALVVGLLISNAFACFG